MDGMALQNDSEGMQMESNPDKHFLKQEYSFNAITQNV